MVLAGGGDASPWQSLAQQLGIEKTLTFAGYRTDLEEYYLRAACLVLPSRKEGISNALLEAQGYGLPAIVSDIPGNREVVVDGVTGCIVPVGDSVRLSEAMLKIYRSPLLRKKYGKAARDRVEKNFSMDCVAVQVKRLYEDLLQ
jgi:glycosyltransferase involved in cell wall biosynthesis